ncbi:voltage-gated potassium channel [Peptoclostridium litorale DSM 5388]|uniref:Ion transport 2 domain-containing protein n=1 Tax=Peptoclostridium litorale DSM 5388 TaxID=1121324 RepID=A0A069RDU6_PEPLI|nr:ion transporter [Peptoclostridium litorale]KDR95244.1 Ion transport 2 domain-containing protein [Peptoclostridium litorale DSM 5388]SIN72832.1 voltage-gated potassium channel [Peptoclostridium litorale DSM 5388]
MTNKTLNKKSRIYYEVMIALLAVIAVSITFLDLMGKVDIESSPKLYYVELCILIIFTVDYFSRLFLSTDKPAFFKENIPDLIAIIPFSSFFRIFRAARLFRIMRFARIFKFLKFIIFAKKLKRNINSFVYTNGFIYIAYMTVAVILFGAIGIYHLEYGLTINKFEDALWWSFVTATTVGYGDISPVTSSGRILAAMLMLVGIGFIGMLTGTIATYFLSSRTVQVEKNQSRIVDLSELSEDEFKEALSFIQYLNSIFKKQKIDQRSCFM